MILKNPEVYQNHMKGLERNDWFDKNNIPKLRCQTKEDILFSMELNAYFSLNNEYPLWMKLVHDVISKMEVEELESPFNYSFRILTDRINIIIQELVWSEESNRWLQREIDEYTIFEGNTHGYVKKTYKKK